MMDDFNARAADWDSDPQRVERAAAVAEAIRRQAPLAVGWQALEYGCGTGLLSFALQPYLGEITLADSAPGMLEVLASKIARSGLHTLHPRLLDLESDALPAERFDLVYTLMTLHHIGQAQKVLQAFAALLRPGGWLCIADLDREDGTFHPPGFSGHLGFERAEISGWLTQAGFENQSFSTPYVMVKGQGAAQRRYPLFLLAGQKA